VSISQLPIVSVDGVASYAPEPRLASSLLPDPAPSRAETVQETDIFAKIERLADLQKKGILSPDEFAAKKAELLSRL
jgi:Short C-terminal domain